MLGVYFGRPAYAQTPAVFSGDRALADVRNLAETIGPRPKGTDEYLSAVAYVVVQLQAAGLPVAQQRFTFVDPRQEKQLAGVNVIAERPGSAGVVILSAHLDTVPLSPGANDNASGVAAVLELARVTADREYPFTLRFIAFAAEEPNRDGSLYYITNLDPGELASIRAVINIDMVGAGGRLEAGGDPELAGMALAAAERDQLDVGPTTQPIRGDGRMFELVGVRTMTFLTHDPRWHTPSDRAEFVSGERLAIAGRLVLEMLDELSGQTASLRAESGDPKRLQEQDTIGPSRSSS